MILDEIETDALTELFNVGLHRAAASLSEITGQRITVQMPRLWICPIAEIEAKLDEVLEGKLATIHQVFGGAVAGDAVLLIEHDKAAALARATTSGEAALGGRLDESAREVLTEIGNIVLGACLSGFGDMMQLPVSFSVPHIHVETLKGFLGALSAPSSEPQYAVIAATRFSVSGMEVDGYLIVAVGAASLARISQALSAGQ